MDAEHSRANPAVVLAHSNQEYHISVPAAAAGHHLQQLPSPICEKYIYPCFKISTIAVSVFIFALFVVVPALVIPDFRVVPASSSGMFNVSTSGICLRCNVRIRVKNPSSYLRVNCTHARATLMYSGKRLSGASLNPFVLGAKKQATVAASSSRTCSRNSWQAITLVSSVSRGEVSFDVDSTWQSAGRVVDRCVRFDNLMQGHDLHVPVSGGPGLGVDHSVRALQHWLLWLYLAGTNSAH